MTAIDLYSGIGGWTLGLRAAGIEVLHSYEWWKLANETHGLNHGSTPPDTNIRELKLTDLPEVGSVDFVVGSPPCTQFSFANRGGNGDIEDGLVDIRKFLEIVRHLQPKAWAMENVPRVAVILRQELMPGGRLEEFAGLVTTIEVLDAAKFGLPQGRKRMIAGSFDVDLLQSYMHLCTPKTLGDVLTGLQSATPRDPNWGFALAAADLTDHVMEPCLTPEETRMNSEAKTHHAVYNKMAFPDSLQRPARTVTATCTRVSRESIIVPCENGYRRLTIRERATLQGFPISFQFASGSYSDRAKMVGNAVPPVLTYFVAKALQRVPAVSCTVPEMLGHRHEAKWFGKSAEPDVHQRIYSMSRSFRFAIPNLRFHSGVRFELRNLTGHTPVKWRVDFYYGSSKKIVKADLCLDRVQRCLEAFNLSDVLCIAEDLLDRFLGDFADISGQDLQYRWIARSSGPGPFELLDAIGSLAAKLEKHLSSLPSDSLLACARYLFPDFNESKFDRTWRHVLAGTALAVILNYRWGTTEVRDERPAACAEHQLQFAIQRQRGFAARQRLTPASTLA